MEVLLADEYGFCFGVERAVEMVEDALDEGIRPIRSLGPLIHNAQEMERLGAKGVSTIDSPDEADGDTIAVIRAHGVTPRVQQELEQRAGYVLGAIEKGDLKLRIHRAYPLEDVRQAHLDLEGRKTTGKLLLIP